MPLYEIRFLKPDDSYTKTVDVELSCDKDLSSFLGKNYSQKNIEVWSDGRRIRRHVSAGHDARLAGWWPRCCRYAALDVNSYEKNHGELPFPLFVALGETTKDIFMIFKDLSSLHRVWIRGFAHPQPPPSMLFVCNLKFHPIAITEENLRGYTSTQIISRPSEGHDIADDLFDAAVAGIILAHQKIDYISTDRFGNGSKLIHAADIVHTNLLFWNLDKSHAIEHYSENLHL